MKPPVKIDALMEEWSKDCTIDETEPSHETAKIPTLHSKYLRILTHHKLIIYKLEREYNSLKAIKWEYYRGKLNNPEDLKTFGWEPITKIINRQDVTIYLESDNDLNNILLKKIIHQEIVDFCTSVLKEISSRTYQLGNMIKWLQFTNMNQV